MWFKNLSLLRLPADFSLAAETFESALAEHPLRSPGPLLQAIEDGKREAFRDARIAKATAEL